MNKYQLKSELSLVLKEVLQEIDKNKRKSYNLNTIENLVYYFDQLDDDCLTQVHDNLINYLFSIKKMEVPNSYKATNELYMLAIYPIIKFYLPLGFKANLSWFVLLYIFIFSLPVLILLKAAFVWYILIIIIFFMLKLYSVIKQTQKKLYGPGW